MNRTQNEQEVNETARQAVIANLVELVVNNETALLVTCGSDHVVRSRPMLNINESFDGDLYFLATSDDDVVRSIKENPRTNVSIAEPASGSYASITGSAEVTPNMKKAELLWNERCTQWFGMEKPTGNIVVVKIDVEDAEYWEQDQSVGHRIAMLFHKMTGGKLTQMDVSHEKVGWNEEVRNTNNHSDPASDESQSTLSLMNHHK